VTRFFLDTQEKELLALFRFLSNKKENLMKIVKIKPRSWQGTNFGTHSATYAVPEMPQARILRTSHGWYAYIHTTKLFGLTKAELEAQLNSPKQIALAKWRDVQRPQYMAKIEHNNRKETALRKSETGHNDPNVVKNCLIYNLPTYP